MPNNSPIELITLEEFVKSFEKVKATGVVSFYSDLILSISNISQVIKKMDTLVML